MDPISRSPINNDVVRETMIHTMNVETETVQDLTCPDLLLTIWPLQRRLTPFKHLKPLSNWPKLAFYDAFGTFIGESGIEFILTESDVLE